MRSCVGARKTIRQTAQSAPGKLTSRLGSEAVIRVGSRLIKALLPNQEADATETLVDRDRAGCYASPLA